MGVASCQHLLKYGNSGECEETLTVQESQYPAANMMHDGVILPSETRKVQIVTTIESLKDELL